MYIRIEKLKKVLNKYGMTPIQFADKIDVEAEEVFYMLEGKCIGVYTSRRFILFLGAGIAQRCIDWDKLGIQNPLKDN